MCRFVLYRGEPITIDTLTTRPKNSIIHQSFQSQLGEQPLNGDGFGLAWYVPDLSDSPALFRSTQPAWNDRNLQQLAEVSKSHLILAHVRAATGDTDVSQANCHPFVGGRFAFMHNGSVANYHQVRRGWMQTLRDESYDQVRGQTDSELMFALFLGELGDSNGIGPMSEAVQNVIRRAERTRTEQKIEEPNFLNLAVTNGREVVATRFASDNAIPRSLFVAQGEGCECEDGEFLMKTTGTHQQKPSRAASTVIASEPLSDQPLWTEVAPGQLLTISSDGRLTNEPIRI
ncbi:MULTISPECIES: class II glutamine amidotransferase [Rhodopirellula]|uniref:class II glutamine amidotransferase n=1 Tax=Rhodopirellula TaxID=265488 RepID=UPI00258095E4|nr:class II glutamine amidotransferase [Rhodopirellula sp. UBA1907]|tara:strand:- start:7773 stop:8636 length:864 start_codon:yes stop_codon:yes gene_type:complete